MVLIGFIVFISGALLAFQDEIVVLAIIMGTAILTIIISYLNRSPAGGLVIGLFTSLTLVSGMILVAVVGEFSGAIPLYQLIGTDFSSSATLILILSEITLYSLVVGLAATGLFFGTLGYVFQKKIA